MEARTVRVVPGAKLVSEIPPPSEHTKLGAIVLEMPGEAVLTATGLVPRKVRQLQTALVVIISVALLMIAAVLYNRARMPLPAPPVVREAAPVKPQSVAVEHVEHVEQAPAVVARAGRPQVTAEEAPPVEVEHPAQPVLEKKKRVVTAAVERAQPEPAPAQQPEKQKVAAPYLELRTLLRELRASTARDNRRYVQLLEGISRAASDLPPATKRAIDNELNSAELTYDVEGLARALQALIKAKGGG